MVIPCYNKEQYISGLFDSILLQEWNNIELVLVNDGSTDKTGNIINAYNPKFIARGYQVVTINQENQGVAAAVRNGLLQISGDFVCQIDADDELDPQYVSLMAGWLENHNEYMWVVCDAVKDSGAYFKTFPRDDYNIPDLEDWIQWRIRRGIWVYMIRTAYLKKCNVVDLYYTEREGNQEAQFLFPLILGGGKLKYISKPLYKYKTDYSGSHQSHRSRYRDYPSAKKRLKGFITATNEIINRMPMTESRKLRLNAMSEINYTGVMVLDAITYGTQQDLDEIVSSLYVLIQEYFSPAYAIVPQWKMLKELGLLLFAAAENNIVGVHPKKLDAEGGGRVIAWGALGSYGKILLDYVKGTAVEPNELWDLRGDGETVKKPDKTSLTPDDTVLVLTRYGANTAGVVNELKDIGCSVFTSEDIITYAASLRFPQFYDGSLKFNL